MTYRVSSSGFHFRSLSALLDAQSRLAKTQEQVATGRRILSPADDPVGATRIQDLSRQQTASEQYLRNNDVARARLSLEEQTLADVSSSLSRIRELVIQASNDTTDYSSRQMIRIEIEGRVQELIDLGNRKDGQGDYLFAGLATLTQPFARVAGAVQYFGDQGTRMQQVSETQRVVDGDSGFDVFGRIAEGNGAFVTSAEAANTGSGSVSTGSVTNRSLWTGGTFKVQFTSSSTWQVVDSALPVPNIVAAGPYASGGAIAFNGISLQVAGTPAAGDEFVVRQAASSDMFSSLDTLAATLAINTDLAADKAQYRTQLDGSIAQLDRALDHMLEVRAGVGVRLNTLDIARGAQEDANINLQQLLSQLRDLDYAEAASRLSLQYTGLQAAQKSMASVGQLGLFDYL
jgi:flagellar hook-associated protein 3 FlgL